MVTIFMANFKNIEKSWISLLVWNVIPLQGWVYDVDRDLFQKWSVVIAVIKVCRVPCF